MLGSVDARGLVGLMATPLAIGTMQDRGRRTQIAGQEDTGQGAKTENKSNTLGVGWLGCGVSLVTLP